MNSADDIVPWRTFRICKSLCISIKYQAIIVSFPLNRQMFPLWNSWHLNLNLELGLWYIPEPKILYIILWAEIIWFTMGIFETSIKNYDTVCSTPRHRWELPGNCPIFTVVMVIYHYVERIWRILVTPVFCITYMTINRYYPGEPVNIHIQ